MPCTLVAVTPGAEKLMAYCARVSSPHQEKEEFAGLLKYCVKNQHWSIFEMANMVIEIETSRAIAQQILRHRSFSFQEFSQRYAAASDYEKYPARRQDQKNRQNSVDDMPPEDKLWFSQAQEAVWGLSSTLYKEALEKGIAKEQARFLLPLNTKSKLYMNGTVRSWIHYLQLRTAHGTQKEHMDLANEIQGIFSKEFPAVSAALGWSGTL
jgi:thymidylate synthase (FAD)